MDFEKDLHELCEFVEASIHEAVKRLRNAGGQVSAGDAKYVDELTHAMKSIKCVMEKMEPDEDGMSSRSYYDGYAGRSYARGRGRNAARDSMGRYSGNDDLRGKLEELMQDADDPTIRQGIQRLVNQM